MTAGTYRWMTRRPFPVSVSDADARIIQARIARCQEEMQREYSGSQIRGWKKATSRAARLATKGSGSCLAANRVAWISRGASRKAEQLTGAELPLDMSLTENEGSLLGVVVRLEPLSIYQLVQIFDASPVAKFNNSKGAVY